MFNHELFLEHFRRPLLGTKRTETFIYVTRTLSRKKNALIIETGCVRDEDDWVGAGQSTEVWNWLVKESEGHLGAISIDNSPLHCDVAKKLCPLVSIVQDDSLHWLMLHKEELSKCDLLYLDSMDHNPPYGDSELHAAGELAIAYPSLPSGCMIMVDDCNPDGTGKHFLIRQFFDRMKIVPAMVDYQCIWVKP